MKRGFTLIELLVVISIIATLASVVLANLNSSRYRAEVAKTAAQVRELRKALIFFVIDTDYYPVYCGLSCTTATDPFNNPLGLEGWNGPYLATDLSQFKHPWGGHLTIGSSDIDNDSETDLYIFLDDDEPRTDSNNNQGGVPMEALQDIDEALDDGNLLTGEVRGLGQWSTALEGELLIRVRP